MHPVFDDLIDYAGLFPPASRTMDEALVEYARHRGGGDRHKLARFVVSARSLPELRDAAMRTRIRPPHFDPWPLSVVMAVDHVDDLARIASLQSSNVGRGFRVEAVEARVNNVGEISVITERFDTEWEVFLEMPHGADFDSMVRAARDAAAGAKIRTGGITPDAFPIPQQLAAFLKAVYEYGIPWKATAGLHHLRTGEYPLTYEPNSPRHKMYGYLNLIFAATAVHHGLDTATAAEILADDSPKAFRRGHDYIAWGDLLLSFKHIELARNNGFRSFGSCSFTEPIEEMVEEFGR